MSDLSIEVVDPLGDHVHDLCKAVPLECLDEEIVGQNLTRGILGPDEVVPLRRAPSVRTSERPAVVFVDGLAPTGTLNLVEAMIQAPPGIFPQRFFVRVAEDELNKRRRSPGRDTRPDRKRRLMRNPASPDSSCEPPPPGPRASLHPKTKA